MALVESLASSPRRRGGTGGRGSATAAARLATTRVIRADRRRTGIAAALGGPRRTVWRGVLAEADGEEIGPGIDAPPSRLAVEDRSVTKTPDPFIVPGRLGEFQQLQYVRCRHPQEGGVSQQMPRMETQVGSLSGRTSRVL